MKLSNHLQRFAENQYPGILIHPEFMIQDRYIFASNRFLKELEELTKNDTLTTEIINIEYDEKSGIPSFILIADNDSLEVFFDKWHVEFMSAYIKSCFG